MREWRRAPGLMREVGLVDARWIRMWPVPRTGAWPSCAACCRPATHMLATMRRTERGYHAAGEERSTEHLCRACLRRVLRGMHIARGLSRGL